jgi:hypothetical protein
MVTALPRHSPAALWVALLQAKHVIVLASRRRKGGALGFRAVPAYSLLLEGPDRKHYVPSRDFPAEMRPGDTFDLGAWTWRVIEVHTRQFERLSKPIAKLRCVYLPVPQTSTRSSSLLSEPQTRSAKRRI